MTKDIPDVGGAKKMEADCSWWCSVTGQDAMDTNWSARVSS